MQDSVVLRAATNIAFLLPFAGRGLMPWTEAMVTTSQRIDQFPLLKDGKLPVKLVTLNEEVLLATRASRTRLPLIAPILIL